MTSSKTPSIAVQTAAKVTKALASVLAGMPVCPSVCPSDWDKRKTLFTSAFYKSTYEERLKLERRGQETTEPSS